MTVHATFGHTVRNPESQTHSPVVILWIGDNASITATLSVRGDTPQEAESLGHLFCNYINSPPPDPLPDTLNSITQSIETLFAEQCERDWAHSPTTRRLLDQLLSDVTIEIQRHNPEETAP